MYFLTNSFAICRHIFAFLSFICTHNPFISYFLTSAFCYFILLLHTSSFFHSQPFFHVQIFHFSNFLPLTGNVELCGVLTRRLFNVRIVSKLQRILTLKSKCEIPLYKRALLFFDLQVCAGNKTSLEKYILYAWSWFYCITSALSSLRNNWLSSLRFNLLRYHAYFLYQPPLTFKTLNFFQKNLFVR